MLKLGLTGSIGSGKTTVAGIFETLGVPVYYADREAKRLYQYPAVINAVTDYFGQEARSDSGEINRKYLASRVFANKDELVWLNNLIHPMVKGDFDCWCNTHMDATYVVHEAAILFESGFEVFFDRNLLVSAPEIIRIQRVMDRDGIDRDAVISRMKHQWTEERKTRLADFIIRNDGQHLLIPQVMEVHHYLLNI